MFNGDYHWCTEALKGHGGGKNSGWVEKNWGGRKTFFFKCFAFSRKTFAFPQETLCSRSKLLRSLTKIFAFSRKDICILSQRYLRSLAKLLRSLAKPVEFGQTLLVYFTACSGSYSSICSQWVVHRVLFWTWTKLDLVVSACLSRHGFGTIFVLPSATNLL